MLGRIDRLDSDITIRHRARPERHNETIQPPRLEELPIRVVEVRIRAVALLQVLRGAAKDREPHAREHGSRLGDLTQGAGADGHGREDRGGLAGGVEGFEEGEEGGLRDVVGCEGGGVGAQEAARFAARAALGDYDWVVHAGGDEGW